MLLQALEYVESPGTKLSTLSPPPLIHELWVSHILETRSYASMCELLVPGGCTINFSQQRRPTAELMAQRVGITMEAYVKEFDVLPSSAVWPNVPSDLLSRMNPDVGGKGSESVSESCKHDQATVSQAPAPPYATSTATEVLFVEDLDGTTAKFEVDLDWTVCHFQLMLTLKFDVPIDDQRLVYSGHRMETCDGRTLRAYCLRTESTVYLGRRLRGCWAWSGVSVCM